MALARNSDGVQNVMAKPPRFSIITCTLNSEKYLFDTIHSVESQQYRNFEHVFIDSFSNDSTLNLINAYQSRSPSNVRLIQLPAQGISNAMNAGIKLAEGDIILHLHGDDFLASDSVLGEVAEVFHSTNASIVIGNCALLGREGEECTWPRGLIRQKAMKLFFKPLMFYANLIPHPSAYVRKEVFERHGTFSEHYKVVMDYDLWFRLLKYEPVVFADRVLSKYRFHFNTISTIHMAAGLDEIDEIRRKYKKLYPLEYSIFQFGLQPGLRLKRLLRNIFSQRND